HPGGARHSNRNRSRTAGHDRRQSQRTLRSHRRGQADRRPHRRGHAPGHGGCGRSAHPGGVGLRADPRLGPRRDAAIHRRGACALDADHEGDRLQDGVAITDRSTLAPCTRSAPSPLLKRRIPMARVPLIQEQDHPEFADVIEKFRAGRRGKLINIYRMLLNAPPLAESWFNHSNTVRWKTTLPGRLREIVIIRMGHLANSQYVLRQHVRDGSKLRHCGAYVRGIPAWGTAGGNARKAVGVFCGLGGILTAWKPAGRVLGLPNGSPRYRLSHSWPLGWQNNIDTSITTMEYESRSCERASRATAKQPGASDERPQGPESRAESKQLRRATINEARQGEAGQAKQGKVASKTEKVQTAGRSRGLFRFKAHSEPYAVAFASLWLAAYPAPAAPPCRD